MISTLSFGKERLMQWIKINRKYIGKGSHFIANKNPEEFNRAVLEFVNKSAKNEK